MENLVTLLSYVAIIAGAVTIVTSGLLLASAATIMADRNTGWMVTGSSTAVCERHRRGFAALRRQVRGDRLVIAEMERWAQLGWRATRRSLWLTAPPLALGLVAAITATVSVALATELPSWHADWIADYLSIYAIGWTAVVLAVVAFMRLPAVRLPVEWSAALALADALAAINETDAGKKRPASVTARRLRDLERVVRRSLRRRYGSDRRLPESRTTRRLARSARQLAAWAAGNRAVAQRESTQLCWSLSGVWREDWSSESSERVVSVHWPSHRFPFGSTTAIATAGPITLLLVDVVSRLIAVP